MRTMTTSAAERGNKDRERPVRVMHLIFTLRSGGMEHGVVKIVNGLDPARVVSTICSTTPADAAMRATVTPGVRVIELNRRAGNDPRVVAAIYGVLRRERPDILHTHAWGTLLEGIVAGRLARVPLIVHGEHGTLQLRGGQVRAQRWAWRHADHLLSVSSRLAERMSALVGMPLDRIRVLRNGVDLTRFGATRERSVRRTFGIADDAGIVIGAVGRLVDVKDHATLIDAVDVLRRRERRVFAVIAGDGPLRPELEARIARRGLEEHVRLLGHRSDVEAIVAGLDVFVQSSTSEGMSNTILEAMASGVPVVATRVGGADEMVVDGDTGILVPPSDAKRMADALERLVSNASLRQAMGSAGRRRTHQEFSLEGMVERYQSFYCNAMRTRMSSRAEDVYEESLSA
jgi:sugar transferase (PEP-CTERM/EpsH1 system associated)